MRLICLVKLKQIDYWLFLQQKWVYLESTMNWNSSFATMVSHMQIPSKNGKENSFTKGKKEVGMATINGVSGFSLVELLPGRKRSHSSSCWVLPPSQSMRTPLPRWSPHSIQLRFLLICNFINLLYLLICNWDFCFLFFLVLSFLVTEGTVWGQIHLLFLIAKAEFSRG